MSAAGVLPPEIEARLDAVCAASRTLRGVSREVKDAALLTAAKLLNDREGALLAANARDMAEVSSDVTPAFRDRLQLTPSRIAHMAESLRQVAALPDPVGEVVERRTLDNGLDVRRVRAPLGVLLMIFESRPNVAVEAFSLAFKAGNAVILRGGKESMRTTAALYELLGIALTQHGVPADVVWGVTSPDRELVRTLLGAKRHIDVTIPRGGDGLIAFVEEHAAMPLIKNDRGLCHVYVHEDGDEDMACRIVENAKTQRPGVCNAMETLLVHRAVAPRLLPRLHSLLERYRVQWHGCHATCTILAKAPQVAPATAASWDTEYLELQLNCKVVDDLAGAIAHIERHGSRHSEAIVTRSAATAAAFQGAIDAAAVYWNASTRFTDGFALGLGGELGISTQKLHARGPVGLRELTSVRWLMDGTGQVRG